MKASSRNLLVSVKNNELRSCIEAGQCVKKFEIETERIKFLSAITFEIISFYLLECYTRIFQLIQFPNL